MSWNPVDWWTRSRAFLGEVRREMKNVSWPTRDEVTGTTVVVVITTFIFGIFLWLADFVLFRMVQFLYEAFGM